MYGDKRKILKYGRLNPQVGSPSVEVVMAASQVLKAAGGMFVYQNSGAATLCDDSTQTIFGYLNSYEHTPTVGDLINCDVDLSGIFRIPRGGSTASTIAMVGAFYDLDIASDIQGVDLGASTHDLLMVVGIDDENDTWVDVMMNGEERG